MYKASRFSFSLLLLTLLCAAAIGQDNPIHSFKSQNGFIQSLAVSPDGKLLLSGSEDKSIVLWSLTEQKEITTLNRHHYNVYALCFTPDGNYFASGGDKNIIIWDKEGRYIKKLAGHKTSVWSIDFSPSGDTLISGSFDHRFMLWDIYEGEIIKEFEGFEESMLATAYSPKGNYIAAANDRQIFIYETDSFKLHKTINAHASNIYDIQFTPDGKKLVSASRDKTIKIWDVATGNIEDLLSRHERSVMSIDISDNGKMIVSGAFDATTIIWDLEKGELLTSFEDHKLPVYAVAFHPDNLHFYSGSGDEKINYYQIPEELIVSNFLDKRYQEELDASPLFEPRRANESRSDYKERQEKAEAFRKKLIKKYMEEL